MHAHGGGSCDATAAAAAAGQVRGRKVFRCSGGAVASAAQLARSFGDWPGFLQLRALTFDEGCQPASRSAGESFLTERRSRVGTPLFTASESGRTTWLAGNL